MDATPVLAAILRDARKSALLRMRSEVLFPFNCQTANRRASAFPRRDASGACVDCPPPKTKRAQGKPGARCTRGLVCKVHKRMRTRAYRSSGGNPAFPARWFTAYSALSLVTGLSCHHRPRKLLLSRTCRQRRGARTTRLRRPPTAAFVFRRLCVHRIPPRVRDDRDPPLSSGETGRACNGDLPDMLSGIFLIPRLDSNFGKSAVICPSGCFVAAGSQDFACERREAVRDKAGRTACLRPHLRPHPEELATGSCLLYTSPS